MTPLPHAPSRPRAAFTLLELILSLSVLVLVMGVLVQIFSSVQTTWRRGADGAATTEAAAHALDLLAADLSGAVASGFPDSGLDVGTDAKSPLVFAVFTDPEAEDAEVEPETAEGDSDEAEATADGFSRILFTAQMPRPVWEGSAGECDGDAPVPSRKESSSRLRSLLGVQYAIEAEEDDAGVSASGDGEQEEPAAQIRFRLVRKTVGLKASVSSGEEQWWELLAQTHGETVASTVVWFSAVVPSFPAGSVNTNETGSAVYEHFANYATREDDSLGLPSEDLESGPLPAMVDIVLGLVPERDMAVAENIAEDADRTEFLRKRTRVYTRRIVLPGWR